MLDIATTKVAQVILYCHEIDRAEPELRAFIGGLNEDEQASLVALMWIGRGSYDADEINEAIAMARQEATTPTEDYLLGSPHLGDHLEAALDALGIDVTDAEDDLL